MLRILLGISVAALTCSAAFADTAERSHAYDDFITQQAKKHGVPEDLVHRILRRESRYDPKVFHNHCYGLMQIKYGTARSMGYTGAPKGLFDPFVNMTYAIPYLANAYLVADRDEDRAVALFAGGYYYAAKKKQLLASLRTAESPPVTPDPPAAAPAPQQNPMADLFAFLQNPAATPPQAPQGAVPPAPPIDPAQAPATVKATENLEPSAQPAPAQEAAANGEPGGPPAAAALDATPTGSLSKAPHGAAKTKLKLALAGKAADGAKAAGHRTKEAKAHATTTASAADAASAGAISVEARSEDAPPASTPPAEKAPLEKAPGGAQ